LDGCSDGPNKMGKDKAIEYTAEEVRKRFLAKCAMEGGVDALGKAAFKDLVSCNRIGVLGIGYGIGGTFQPQHLLL